jgi:transcriptional regulator with XRE-family HTH domain
MELSLRISRWRKARGLSLAKLAKAAGTTAPAIAHIEHGRAQPSIRMLDAVVAKGLGETMSRFYNDKALIAAERRASKAA